MDQRHPIYYAAWTTVILAALVGIIAGGAALLETLAR